jgi:GxxExxY protein
MPHSTSRQKRPTLATNRATGKLVSTTTKKPPKCQNTAAAPAARTKGKGDKKNTSLNLKSNAVQDLEKGLQQLSLSKPFSPGTRPNDDMFSIFGKSAFQHTKATSRFFPPQSSKPLSQLEKARIPKHQMLPAQPLIESDAFKHIINTVHRKVGINKKESEYEKCLIEELKKRGFMVKSQLSSELRDARVDLALRPSPYHDWFLVELKAIENLRTRDIEQTLRYIPIYGVSNAALINFGIERPEVFLAKKDELFVHQLFYTDDAGKEKTSAWKTAKELISLPSPAPRCQRKNGVSHQSVKPRKSSSNMGTRYFAPIIIDRKEKRVNPPE